MSHINIILVAPGGDRQTVWVVGLFVVMWFILKTLRNNRQFAFLASIDRALTIYLDDTPQFQKTAG